jgi:hypothetical protein
VPSIKGLVLAGAAELKNELVTSGMMDPRLVAIIVKSVDTSYGGENGFNQAIALAADALASVKFTEERALIQRFFDEITMDTGKYCFGLKDTFTALEQSAVETLVVYEDMDTVRVELKHPTTAAKKVLFLSSKMDTEKERAAYTDEAGVELEVVDKTPLVDKWKQKFKAVLARPLEGSTALFFRRLTTESVLCAMGKRKGPPNIMTLPTPLALQRRLAFYLQHLRNVVRVNLEVYEQTYSDIFMAAAAI